MSLQINARLRPHLIRVLRRYNKRCGPCFTCIVLVYHQRRGGAKPEAVAPVDADVVVLGGEDDAVFVAVVGGGVGVGAGAVGGGEGGDVAEGAGVFFARFQDRDVVGGEG